METKALSVTDMLKKLNEKDLVNYVNTKEFHSPEN
jgi:Mn-dependent DtxR family transcriptional regulator